MCKSVATKVDLIAVCVLRGIKLYSKTSDELLCEIRHDHLGFVLPRAVAPLFPTRGKGGLWPPSPLVWVAGATLISSEEVVSSELINLFECNVYIKNKFVES